MTAGPAASEGAEVLARGEAEAGDVGPLPDSTFVDRRPEREAGVLDDRETVPSRDRTQGRHVGRVTVEVDGEDRGGSRGHRRVDLDRIDVAGIRLDVDPDRGSARVVDRRRRADVAVRDGDHLVTPPDAEGEQGHLERGRAGVRSDGVGNPHPLGEFRLEGRHLGAPVEPPALQHPRDRRVQARLELPIDNGVVVKGYRHEGSCFAATQPLRGWVVSLRL